ncbi:MAG: choice-of-anchor E domain-containing protein, partial [Planctomycetes bacterium]|nr:choice-of-anchor E domain-containing protein [Planctomycetota bacterium]
MKVNNSALGLLVLALAWLTPRIEAQGPGGVSGTSAVTPTPTAGAASHLGQRTAPLGPGLCAGGTPAGCCGTSTVSFTGSIGPIQPPSSSQVTVSKFDPALGQLLKVEYTVTITIPNTAQFPNRAQFENTNTSSSCTLSNYS